MKHTKEDLKIMQGWSLAHKIRVTQTRIIEWYQHFNGAVCVSFSGGKDSSVLLDLVRRAYPDVEAVYVDTGLEFPEVRQFAMSKENVTILKPTMNFRQVIDEYGWCYPSKDVAKVLHYAKKGSLWALRRLLGLNSKDGTPSKYCQTHYMQWAYLKDSPFKISAKCCEIMKERPAAQHQKQTGKRAFVGTLAGESYQRQQAWLITGCNGFDARRQISKPLSFWTEQDILRYLKDFDIPYASVYGEIIEDANGKLQTTGETRTGCMFCAIGCHHEKTNRFQRMAKTHPQLYDYCINKLNLRELLDFVGVKY